MKSSTITNYTIQFLRSLSQKKIRDKNNLFIVEGWNSINELINSNLKIEILVTCEVPKKRQSIFEKAKTVSTKWYDVTEKEMSKISNTEHSQGILAAVSQINKSTLSSSILKNEKLNIIVTLDSISDPGNLGAIIRTCDWFGVNSILISKESVDLYNPKVVQSTMGSLFHLPISNNIDLLESIHGAKNSGFKIIGTDVYGKNILSNKNVKSDLVSGKKIMLIIGNEAHGISENIKKEIESFITIPKYGNAESLNAAVALGIILAGIKNE